MDLTEAEDIKKRWQEYTEELYKTDLHDSDNHDGVITHLEPDILQWVPCTPPRNLPNPEITPMSLISPTLAGRFFTTRATWEAL